MVRRKNDPEVVYNQTEKKWQIHERNASLVSPILDAIVDNDPGPLLNAVIEASETCPICGAADCWFFHRRSR